MLARSADLASRRVAEGDADRDFLLGKLATTRFYAAQILPQSAALASIVANGAASVVEVDASLI